MASVTIYNDDKHGRAIRVVKVNPYTDAPPQPLPPDECDKDSDTWLQMVDR